MSCGIAQKCKEHFCAAPKLFRSLIGGMRGKSCNSNGWAQAVGLVYVSRLRFIAQ